AGESARSSLVDLVAAGLVREVPERGAPRFDVAHEQVREVYLEGASEQEVQRLTELLSGALGDLSASDPLVQIEFLAQRAPERALELARGAIADARVRGAVQLEAALLERVLSLGAGEASPTVLADLGKALLCSGRCEEGALRLGAAADAALAQGEIQLATRWR